MLLEGFLETTMPEFDSNLEPSPASYTEGGLPPSLHTIRLSWTQYPESLPTDLPSIIHRLRLRLWEGAANAKNVDFPEMLPYPTVASSTGQNSDHVFEHLKNTDREGHPVGFEEQIGRMRLIFSVHGHRDRAQA